MERAATCTTCGQAMPAESPSGVCARCAAAARQSDTTVPSGAEIAATIAGFEVLGVLGQGGMGVVFKARQAALERLVAVKVLAPGIAATPGFADRFRREAKAMARLAHPNIVAVHEYGVAGELPYLVLQYVEGVDLRKAMAAGRARGAEALAIVPQICDALQYAHDRGVVHRDIKPENVLLRPDGRVAIADFGLAKLAIRTGGESSLTATGQVMGTMRYMAPEQWERPNDVDHRADIYSLGVLFYEMLTGELPVGRFEPPSRKSGSDVRLDEIVLRSLERDRERRWQRVDEMSARLAEIVAGRTAALPPHTPRPTAQRSPERTEETDIGGESDPAIFAQYLAAVAAAGSAESRVELCSGDMVAMPFPDASLDNVVASLSVHNIDDDDLRAGAVREIRRVLRPGGSVALIDFRHGAEFADLFRVAGMERVELSPVSTWLALPVRIVTARRPPSLP